MQLQEKDIEILSTIANLRFLTTQQLHSIHGNKSAKYGLIVTRRKLKSLEEKKLLQSWQPSKYDSKIYYLTKNGAQELSLFTGQEKIRTYSKSNNTLHQVMVSDIYCALRNCKAGRLRRFILNLPIGDATADALIEFQMGDKVKLLALEADRATERIGIIKEKLDAYWYECATGSWQKKYGVFPEIAFVTVSDTRKRTILRLREEYKEYKDMRIRVLTMDEFEGNPAALVY